MAGQSTVLSAQGGLVTVPSSGPWTASGIAQVQSLLSANNVVEVLYVPGQPIPTVPSGAAGTYALEVQNGTAFGTLAIPDNYGAVILGQGSSGSVTGGTANTTVLSGASSMTYTGTAGEIVASATVSGVTGNFTDSLGGARFDLGGGSYSLTASGNNDTIQVDNSAAVSLVAAGSGDQVQLGDPPGSAAAVASAALASGSGSVSSFNMIGRGDAVTVNSFGNIIADTGSSNSITGASGSSTIFAGSNEVYFGASAVTEFVAGAGAQTVFGGTGNDTVFSGGTDTLTYNEGSGSANIAVNINGNMTINGNGAGAVFTGGGATSLVLGNGHDALIAGGGSDSVYGGSTTPTIFGGSNVNAVIVGSLASFVLAQGTNSTFNASLTSGGDNFFFSSATGNTTLVASSGSVPDTFNLSSVAGGSAHTITIQNWHTGDAMFLGGYSASDVQAADSAINGGKTSFVLSDGTTVTFASAQHPTAAIGTTIF